MIGLLILAREIVRGAQAPRLLSMMPSSSSIPFPKFVRRGRRNQQARRLRSRKAGGR